jgi:hypothetical protein
MIKSFIFKRIAIFSLFLLLPFSFIHALTLSEFVEILIQFEVIPQDKASQAREFIQSSRFNSTATDSLSESDVRCSFPRSLREGMSGMDVYYLQKFLNNTGHIVSESGEGSPGNETQFFGEKTNKALFSFKQALGDEFHRTPVHERSVSGFARSYGGYFIEEDYVASTLKRKCLEFYEESSSNNTQTASSGVSASSQSTTASTANTASSANTSSTRQSELMKSVLYDGFIYSVFYENATFQVKDQETNEIIATLPLEVLPRTDEYEREFLSRPISGDGLNTENPYLITVLRGKRFFVDIKNPRNPRISFTFDYPLSNSSNSSTTNTQNQNTNNVNASSQGSDILQAINESLANSSRNTSQNVPSTPTVSTVDTSSVSQGEMAVAGNVAKKSEGQKEPLVSTAECPASHPIVARCESKVEWFNIFVQDETHNTWKWSNWISSYSFNFANEGKPYAIGTRISKYMTPDYRGQVLPSPAPLILTPVEAQSCVTTLTNPHNVDTWRAVQAKAICKTQGERGNTVDGSIVKKSEGQREPLISTAKCPANSPKAVRCEFKVEWLHTADNVWNWSGWVSSYSGTHDSNRPYSLETRISKYMTPDYRGQVLPSPAPLILTPVEAQSCEAVLTNPHNVDTWRAVQARATCQ